MQTQPVEQPSAAPTMNSGSLPDQARGYTDSVLLKTERVTAKFFPQNNGTFSPSGSRTIRFDISSSMFLDLSQARLCCNIAFTNATGQCMLDGGLGGCISRLSILNSSGQLLERIDDYALLQTVLLQCSSRARDHESSLWLEEAFIANTHEPLVDKSLAVSAVGTTGAPCRYKGGQSVDLSHRFHGAWFQTQRKKLLPPGIMFRVEIELVDSANEALVSNAASSNQTLTLSNVYINIPTVQIMSQAFEDATMNLLRRGWQWMGTHYKRYTYSVTSGTASDQQLNVPDKSLALTGLMAIARRTADLNNELGFQNYFRAGDVWTSQYNVQIGSQQYPASKIDYAQAHSGDSITAGDSVPKLSTALQQIESVLGYVPLNSYRFFSSAGNNTSGADGTPKYGSGFQAVQVGYSQGLGMDTASASLPVLFSSQITSSEPLTVTIYTQTTATFRMETTGGGMINVSSFM